MKTVLSTLIFLLTLAGHGANVYLSSAWYDTKTIPGLPRCAGEIRMWLFETNTVKVEFWFIGTLLQTGEGTWTDAQKSQRKVAVNMSHGQVLKGSVSSFTDFGTGNYRGGGTSGKWQAIRP